MLRPVILLAFAALAAGQEFEEASIKSTDPASPELSWNTSPGMLRIKGMTLKNFIQSAYSVNAYQIAGGPKWLDGDRYDITAKLAAGDGAATSTDPNRFQPALRKLLEQRFRLAFHYDERSVSGYVLVLAKTGLRLHPVEGATGGGYGSSGPSMMNLRNSTMDVFASAISSLLRTPVRNQTGVEGAYDIKLEFAPEGRADSAGSDKPSFFTAIQEQLGLKLEPGKVPVRMFVVDSAEKPEVH